jgi:hypothetical protein
MSRVLRVVTVALFTFVAVLLVGLAVTLSRIMTALPRSLGGAEPGLAPVGLWAFAVIYVLLAVVTAIVLLSDQQGALMLRVRRAVLPADVAVHVVLVAISLPLAGWQPFLCAVALLTLLTMALPADSEPAPAGRNGRPDRAIRPAQPTGR